MLDNKDELYRNAYDMLCAYMDKHSMRYTSERFYILEQACKLQRFTIGELRNSLADMLISRATVYNAIELMEKAGIIRLLEKEYGVRAGRYELTFLKGSSLHIICELCGRTREFKDPTFTRMLEDKRFSNFIVERYSLYLYGRCKTCKRLQKKKTT